MRSKTLLPHIFTSKSVAIYRIWGMIEAWLLLRHEFPRLPHQHQNQEPSEIWKIKILNKDKLRMSGFSIPK